jgi:hypothetical protein
MLHYFVKCDSVPYRSDAHTQLICDEQRSTSLDQAKRVGSLALTQLGCNEIRWEDHPVYGNTSGLVSATDSTGNPQVIPSYLPKSWVREDLAPPFVKLWFGSDGRTIPYIFESDL